MMQSELICVIYRYLSVKGVGPAMANKLFISASNNQEQIDERYLKASLTDEQKSQFDMLLDYTIPHTVAGQEVGYMHILSSDYPERLVMDLSANAPTVISYIGNSRLLHSRCIVFSGSRKVSDKGIEITRAIIEELTSVDNICVVAGYAAGVDRTALHTALECGIPSIVVLPEGISHFTIRQELRDVWDWDKVLVVSQFKPQEAWSVSNAMLRNGTIIALGNVIVVVEAGESGGSMDAGLKSIQFGKSLFVPYYQQAPESARGNESLIRRGAIPLRMVAATHKPNLTKMKESLMMATTLF